MPTGFSPPAALDQSVVREGEISSSPVRIPELDGLRGCAILLVILCHYVGNANHAPLGPWPHRFLAAFTIGWSGVDLFFVLSGFLIGGILVDARSCPHYFQTFYMRRVFRILPIYYLWIILFIPATIAATFLFPYLGADLSDIVRVPVQLLFLQNFFTSMSPFQWFWFAVTWSLAIEEQFYLLAPPLIRFLSTRSLIRVLAATICLAPLLRFLVFRYLSLGHYGAVVLMPCRADSLSWGILLALGWRSPEFRAFLERRASRIRQIFLFFAAGVGVLFWWLADNINLVTATIGFSWLAVFYSLLLLLLISQPGGTLAAIARWSLLRKLGAISYCVYILHDAFNFLAHRLLLHANPRIYDASGIAVTLFALAFTIAVASLSWRFFEKPLIRRGHTYSYSEAAP